ncbi:TrkH family potassium uptake protein [Desulfonema ishimotonii]|nr:TrkH family potassium uptake protein [Desulfonema ishimotonii]
MVLKLKRLRARISKWFLEFPGRSSVIGFSLLIATGTALLMLPAASAGPPVKFIDALFTATSASCVTGLVVMDTGTALTPWGQGVILLLIQIGGLGIMTISTLFLMLAGKRPGMMERMAIRDTFTHQKDRKAADILREVMLFAFSIEAAGALILFFCFLPDNSPGRALYTGVFHAISAFCNAGFSLFADSLTGYRESWVINLTVSFLIITGGVGFLVLSELRGHLRFSRRTWSRLSLHSKLALSSTLMLLGVSTLLFLFMEWDNTLTPLSVPGRILAAFFQAVSARTAGFNTLAFEHMANETLFLIIVMMFIGACPGSCGGGVKTTTIFSLTLLGLSRFQGHDRPRIFRRSIPEASVWRAVNVVMISSLVIVLALMLLLISELGNVSHLQSRGKFLEFFFEVVSAFGTVGLSTGVTAGLSLPGKLIITAVMFIGRLGPLVIGIAFSRRRRIRYHYAEEQIMIG